MLQLQALGTLELRSSDGSAILSLLSHPKTMALLVTLVLEQPRGYQRRDHLCTLFWPESDAEHARGSLSQALHRIRRSVGEGVVETRGPEEVRVRPGSIACDVIAFEEAVDRGDHGEAMTLYRGPLLLAFHVHEAQGFERWLEVERDRVRELAGRAARGLALDHVARGELVEAESMATRALELDPADEAAVRELLNALAAAGDRVGAVRVYQSWAEWLRLELEASPSAELEALANELRREAHAPAPSRSPVDGPANDDTAPVPGASRGFLAARAWRTWPPLVLALAIVGFASYTFLPIFPGAGRTYAVTGHGGLDDFTGRDWLILVDFEAPPEALDLALVFQTLLAHDLQAAGYAGVAGGVGSLGRARLAAALERMRLPPHTHLDTELACQLAEREGAAGVIAGQVLPVGGNYMLKASVLRAADCLEAVRVVAMAPGAEVSSAVTALSREMRRRLGERPREIRGSPPLPAYTTSSVAALRLVRQVLYEPAGFREDVALLREALTLDPDFAMAHVELGSRGEQRGGNDLAMVHYTRAFELRLALPRPERLFVEAISYRSVASDPWSSMAAAEMLIADHPDMAELLLPYVGVAAAWTGDWQRLLDVSLEQLRRWPAVARFAHGNGWIAAMALGQTQLADSLGEDGIRALQEAGRPWDRRFEMWRGLYAGDFRAAEAPCGEEPAPGTVVCPVLFLSRGKLAASAPVETWLAHGRPTVDETLLNTALPALSYAEHARGRPDQAWSRLEEAGRALGDTAMTWPDRHLARFVLCSMAAYLGRPDDLTECRIEGEIPRQWDDDGSFHVVLRSGAWSRRLLAVRSLARGDPSTALQQARGAVQSNFANPGVIDHLIHALAFDALARPDSAMARYVASVDLARDCFTCFPTSYFFLLHVAPVYRRIGDLAEAAGDTATAARYYQAFVDFWEEADPELQPQVEAVRARLRDLEPPVGMPYANLR
jgi:DNA-binding SARP family transcriptional activator